MIFLLIEQLHAEQTFRQDVVAEKGTRKHHHRSCKIVFGTYNRTGSKKIWTGSKKI